MKPRYLLLAMCSFAVTLSGCMRKPVQLLDSTIPLPEEPESYYLVREAHGRACQFDLLFLIPIGGNQAWKARNKAVGDDSDGLVDVSMDAATAFTPLGPVFCTDVRGLAVRYGEPPPGYGPVVLREKVVVEKRYVDVERPVPTDGAPVTEVPPPSTPSRPPPSGQYVGGAEVMASAAWNQGVGMSFRQHIRVLSPDMVETGDRLDAGIGADLYVTGPKSLVVPLQLRYTLLDIAGDGIDIYGLGELGITRSLEVHRSRAYLGVAGGVRYALSPNAAALLELGFPALRAGIQASF